MGREWGISFGPSLSSFSSSLLFPHILVILGGTRKAHMDDTMIRLSLVAERRTLENCQICARNGGGGGNGGVLMTFQGSKGNGLKYSRFPGICRTINPKWPLWLNRDPAKYRGRLL